jgi:hypothetical protein
MAPPAGKASWRWRILLCAADDHELVQNDFLVNEALRRPP